MKNSGKICRNVKTQQKKIKPEIRKTGKSEKIEEMQKKPKN